MSTSAQTFAIIGAGLAGAKAAQELRDRGFDGRVVLIGDEQELPYERPPLTKGYLRGEQTRQQARVHDEDRPGRRRPLIERVHRLGSLQQPALPIGLGR